MTPLALELLGDGSCVALVLLSDTESDAASVYDGVTGVDDGAAGVDWNWEGGTRELDGVEYCWYGTGGNDSGISNKALCDDIPPAVCTW